MTKIVVADDTADIRELVKWVLGRDGVDVLTAGDGAEALELIFRERPDAVLLDVAMPLVDGLEALARMAADPDLARIPVMMLTSNSQAENVQRALQLGARDFVVKPFDPKTLRERVRRLLAIPPALPGQEPAEEAIVPPELRITPKVLVVDPRAETLEMAQQILRGRFDVVTAGTGAGALAAAAHHLPDVVVMDLAMPLMDGHEALRRLRELPQLARTKVLAMALESPGERRLRGFDGVVGKPLERHELLGAISRVMGVSGLLSFVIQDGLVVLRVHASPLWDAAPEEMESTTDDQEDTLQWRRRDLDPLHAQAERAFARMIETGQTRLVVDLDELVDGSDYQLRAVVTVMRTVLERARECRLRAKIVAPRVLDNSVLTLVAGLPVEVCRSFAEAQHGFRRGRTQP